jgi:hypothetical protein
MMSYIGQKQRAVFSISWCGTSRERPTLLMAMLAPLDKLAFALAPQDREPRI